MYKIKRRHFLKFLSFSTLATLIPHVAIGKNNENVIFLNKRNKLYEIFRQPFNKRIKVRPEIIAVCHNEAGVQEAILYANKLNLPISIKSGGHSFEGFSLNDGMVIDISKMNSLEFIDEKHLHSEPGVKLSELYDFCLPKGRLLPSGSCGTVGLSGITLGGGYGLFSRQFGLTSDHLIGLRMIDAKGNILDSNDDPEILWACRGGGNGNFGVITQLRYKTVPAPKTLYQHRFRSYKLTPAKAKELVEFWFDETKDLPEHAFSAFVFSGNTVTVMITSTEHDEKMKVLLKNIDARMDKNVNLKPDPIEVGIKYYYGVQTPLNFKNISSGYYKDFNHIRSFIKKVFIKVSQTKGMIFQINTLGGEINNSSMAKKSAYPHRNINYLSEAQCYWGKDKEEPRCMQAMKDVQMIISQNGIDQHYVNYPDLNIENYLHDYYGSSYNRLKRLKMKLDPRNRFSYSQSIKS